VVSKIKASVLVRIKKAVEADGDEPRHFDYRWLTSKHATFALTGIVNRIDKRDFNSRNSGHGPCGEVRFIYRLSYQAEDASSSMPFFLNAAYRIPFEDCKVAASLWDLPDKIDSPSSISDWLQKGALKDIVFDRLETNFQSLRFTSGYMHDFGGQAMYMQRVYQKISAPDGSRNVMVPITLENTPDVLAIKKNP